MPEKLSFQRHKDDKGVDEILFVDRLVQTIEEAQAHAFLRIALIERYKTSGLSGDEWRFSCGLYIREGERQDWRLISTEGSLDAMCAALYPSIYGDLQQGKWTKELVDRKVGNVTFQWKGLPVWGCSYDGEATDFLVAAGHLPWAWMMCGDQGSDPGPLNTLCCQPGCVELLVSVYRLKHRFCVGGHKSDAGHSYTKHGEDETVVSDVRGFCVKHLRRGDCGLEDSDDNYEVVSGPGPNGHEPDPDVVKQAQTAPPIFLNPGDLDV